MLAIGWTESGLGGLYGYHYLCAGYITGSQWSSAVESVLNLDVPWNMLRHRLVNVLPDGRVDYASCVDQYIIETGIRKVGGIT